MKNSAFGIPFFILVLRFSADEFLVRCHQTTWSDWAVRKQPLEFSHGKQRLKSLDFDVHDYGAETLVDLALEIFLEV